MFHSEKLAKVSIKLLKHTIHLSLSNYIINKTKTRFTVQVEFKIAYLDGIDSPSL